MFSKRKAIKRSPHVCPLMFKMAYAVDGDRAHKKNKKQRGVCLPRNSSLRFGLESGTHPN